MHFVVNIGLAEQSKNIICAERTNVPHARKIENFFLKRLVYEKGRGSTKRATIDKSNQPKVERIRYKQFVQSQFRVIRSKLQKSKSIKCYINVFFYMLQIDLSTNIFYLIA